MRIDDEKQQIRNAIKIRKRSLTFEEKVVRSNRIHEQLSVNSSFVKASTVLFYWSMKDEVYTHVMVEQWSRSKTIILPTVAGDRLELKQYKGTAKMIEGENYGIPEPTGPVFKNPEDIDVVIVPGVAFDLKNNRMGRGKAYYDKLLHNLNAYKLGVCFDFQLLDSIPVDELDVKMDLVLTC
ncbi:MAG: 5-formyltetrahydrofolate cyclo-ligase [Marinilabiliales bacterium]|nr:MAG: 5-formyltetrahydrofolate cyclo-ligase [Marinilabiliales bacterium]